MLDTQQDCRHQNDRCDSIRDSQVAPLDPVMSSKMIGDREGGAPKGGRTRNDDNRNQNKNDRIAAGDQFERSLDKDTKPRGCEYVLDGVENLTVQSV